MMKSIIKKRVNKVMMKYRKYQDFMHIHSYRRISKSHKIKEAKWKEAQNFINTVDEMLIKLSDDELFIIISIFNLEYEPYLRKFEAGQVPNEEIIIDLDKSRSYFFKYKKSAYEKLYNYMKKLDLDQLKFDKNLYIHF